MRWMCRTWLPQGWARVLRNDVTMKSDLIASIGGFTGHWTRDNAGKGPAGRTEGFVNCWKFNAMTVSFIVWLPRMFRSHSSLSFSAFIWSFVHAWLDFAKATLLEPRKNRFTILNEISWASSWKPKRPCLFEYVFQYPRSSTRNFSSSHDSSQQLSYDLGMLRSSM